MSEFDFNHAFNKRAEIADNIAKSYHTPELEKSEIQEIKPESVVIEERRSPHEQQSLVKSQIAGCFSNSDEAVTDEELEKAATDFFEKGGKRAVIGETRHFGGREYIKTASGWKFHGKGTGKKATEHRESSKQHHAAKEGGSEKHDGTDVSKLSDEDLANHRKIAEKLGNDALKSGKHTDVAAMIKHVNKIDEEQKKRQSTKTGKAPQKFDKETKAFESNHKAASKEQREHVAEKYFGDKNKDLTKVGAQHHEQLSNALHEKMQEDKKQSSAKEEKSGKKEAHAEGTIKEYGGRQYIKKDGKWKYHPKGSSSTEPLMTNAMYESASEKLQGKKGDKEILNAMRMSAKDAGTQYTEGEYQSMLKEFKNADKSSNASEKQLTSKDGEKLHYREYSDGGVKIEGDNMHKTFNSKKEAEDYMKQNGIGDKQSSGKHIGDMSLAEKKKLAEKHGIDTKGKSVAQVDKELTAKNVDKQLSDWKEKQDAGKSTSASKPTKETVSFDWKDIDGGIRELGGLLKKNGGDHWDDGDYHYISSKPITADIKKDIEENGFAAADKHNVFVLAGDDDMNDITAAFRGAGLQMKSRKDHEGTDQYGFDVTMKKSDQKPGKSKESEKTPAVAPKTAKSTENKHAAILDKIQAKHGGRTNFSIAMFDDPKRIRDKEADSWGHDKAKLTWKAEGNEYSFDYEETNDRDNSQKDEDGRPYIVYSYTLNENGKKVDSGTYSTGGYTEDTEEAGQAFSKFLRSKVKK